MILNRNMPLDQFEEEMQVRVVRYGPRAKATKEALRFAEHHSDPAYQQIARDKIEAQEQFLSETYGPPPIEKIKSALAPFLPREVLVTVAMIATAVIGYDFVRTTFWATPDASLQQIDIDELTRQVSARNREDMSSYRLNLQSDLNTHVSKTDWRSLIHNQIDDAFKDKKIQESTLGTLSESLNKLDVEDQIALKIEDAIQKSDIKKQIAGQIVDCFKSEEFASALNKEVSNAVDAELTNQSGRLVKLFDEKLKEHSATVTEVISQELKALSLEIESVKNDVQDEAIAAVTEKTDVRLDSIREELEKLAVEQLLKNKNSVEAVLDKIQSDQEQIPGMIESDLRKLASSDEFWSLGAKSILRSLAQQEREDSKEKN